MQSIEESAALIRRRQTRGSVDARSEGPRQVDAEALGRSSTTASEASALSRLELSLGPTMDRPRERGVTGLIDGDTGEGVA